MDLALSSGVGRYGSEVRASSGDTSHLIGSRVAVVDGVLESGDVPAVEEVSVPSVASRVRAGVDEGPVDTVPAAPEG